MNSIKNNSLPEFNNRGTPISKLFARQVAKCGVDNGAVQAFAVAEDLDAVLCVPWVVAGGPGQRGIEGLYEVVETPGKYHDVVCVTEEHNHHGGIAKS